MQTCRRAITVNGTAGSPITIRAADGETPIVTRPQPADFNYDQNNLEIIHSSFLVIRGLHFKGGDGGVSLVGGHHITFEANEVYETGNNARFVTGGSGLAAFTNPSQLDFWPPPTSILIGRADASFAAALDFNERVPHEPVRRRRIRDRRARHEPGVESRPGLQAAWPGRLRYRPWRPSNLRLQ